MEKVKLEDRRLLTGCWEKLYSFQKNFFLPLFVLSCLFLALNFYCNNPELFKMLFSRISVLASAVAVSQAQLYPGQSNLNHTCQLRTFLIIANSRQLELWSNILSRNSISVLFRKRLSKRHGFMLYGNIWRASSQHPILGYIYWSRVWGPSTPCKYMDTSRSLAWFLQWFIYFSCP